MALQRERQLCLPLAMACQLCFLLAVARQLCIPLTVECQRHRSSEALEMALQREHKCRRP